MLKDVQKKYGEIFEIHFKEIFQGSLDVKCNWGLPIIEITLISEGEGENKIKSIWSFSIDVVEEKYNIAAKAFKMVDEKEISEASVISSEIVDFVVNNLLKLKDMVCYYLTETFNTKSYQENMLFYQQCLVVMSSIQKLIPEITFEEEDTESK